MKNDSCTSKFTEKDLLYLEDMFSWNSNALKLVNHFMNETENEEVNEILEEVFDMHYENLNRCISILEGKYLDDYEDDYEEGHCHCDCDECNCEEDECEEEDDDE